MGLRHTHELTGHDQAFHRVPNPTPTYIGNVLDKQVTGGVLGQGRGDDESPWPRAMEEYPGFLSA